MKKIENLEQYMECEKIIDELIDVVNDDTPKTDLNYLRLEEASLLIEEYDKIHYPIGKDRNKDQ